MPTFNAKKNKSMQKIKFRNRKLYSYGVVSKNEDFLTQDFYAWASIKNYQHQMNIGS